MNLHHAPMLSLTHGPNRGACSGNGRRWWGRGVRQHEGGGAAVAWGRWGTLNQLVFGTASTGAIPDDEKISG